jgi:hypothetical protein
MSCAAIFYAGLLAHCALAGWEWMRAELGLEALSQVLAVPADDRAAPPLDPRAPERPIPGPSRAAPVPPRRRLLIRPNPSFLSLPASALAPPAKNVGRSAGALPALCFPLANTNDWQRT